MNKEEKNCVFAGLSQAKYKARQYIGKCAVGLTDFRLTPKAEVSPYALCFALFGMHLLHDTSIQEHRTEYIRALYKNIREERRRHNIIPKSKPYRQLLTFTLSALSLLDALEQDPLEDLIVEQIEDNIEDKIVGMLTDGGVLNGFPQTGNQAMFMAIFLLHARDWLGIKIGTALEKWLELHLIHINRFGFWGSDRWGMTHLQFQNGYHQYEILEYLQYKTGKEIQAANSVAALTDKLGHFAPYPGGGGCYDYDAVVCMTPAGKIADDRCRKLLMLTATTILQEQCNNGGFSESLYIRPYSVRNYLYWISHVFKGGQSLALLAERSRRAIVLQRPKHNRLNTHWSQYSRRWNEANLWDSWFRMLTLARIQVAFEPDRATDWGFINYPGIGFHPCLRQSNSVTK
ncbi:MAG: hypothetical protein JXA04_07140 [Gammaproteobacteria bacterium]|nr:hypothetical protein [Gammaproteobacteria bacterium]